MNPKTFFLLLLAIPACWQLHAAAPDRGFVSRQPAATWEQALVAGNGIQGALVYGVPTKETIILNHGRLYLPLHPPLPPPDTASRLPELRRLMAEGRFQQAADRVVAIANQEGYDGKRWTDPFIPACDLTISQPAAGATTAYQRSVDFASGVAAVEWHDDRGGFARRVFVSRADNVIALSFTGPDKGAVDCQLELSSRPAAGQGGWDAERMFRNGIKDTKTAAAGGFLTYRADFSRSWPGSLQGYEVTARVITTGGSTVTDGGSIRISGADEVVVLARIQPLTDASHSRLPEVKAALAALPPDFNALLARHTAIHGPLFRRVRFDLGGNDDRSLATEELLEKSKVGHLSPALLEKVFDSGRYVILSNTDICGGLPAVVLAMLVDSRAGHLDLLPALPKQWPRGCVEGVRCRGNIEVCSLRWSPDRIEATLRSGSTQTITVSLPGEPTQLRVDLPAGARIPLSRARSQP